MTRESISTFFKLSVTAVGAGAICLAASNLNPGMFSWKFALLALFTVTVAPRMSLTLPRSKFALSFSDSMIFLTFLLYGGEAAIILAVLETAASCLYLKSTGFPFGRWMIPSNIGAAALATAITFMVWKVIPLMTGLNPASNRTTDLITFLGMLSIAQFASSSVYAAIIESLKNETSVFRIWKKECFAISTTQIAGAAMAGVIYKLINYGEILTVFISFLVFVIGYLNYRQTIKEISESIEQAELAEREKAETERQRRQEAERYAGELQVLLDEQTQITGALQQSRDDLQHAAFHDFLTALPNRAYLIERLQLLLEIGIQTSSRYYVLFLDLHKFKNINDSLGHTTGDKILKLVAKRLLRCVRPQDTVARLGGDEFAIILNDLPSIEAAEEYATRIYERLTQPFSLRGNKIFTSLYIGLSPFDSDYSQPEEILRDADIAMHHAKEKNLAVAVFDKDLRMHVLDNLKLESDLRFANERGELSMFYQPLVSLRDGEIIGFEALLRWQHPTRGFISPAQFIPIAEETGLIIPITDWILKETTVQIAAWQKISHAFRNLMVSVNISGKHLAADGLVGQVEKVLSLAKLSPSSLKLEITETTAMENAERAIEILTRLKEIGVQLSIDDFGTGYSSLNYLHRLPFDTLKIDRSFVFSVGENGENSEILRTILSLAKNLKMRVIAEGIETESQLRILQQLGCEFGQGYLFSKPMPREDMEKMLYQKHFWLPQGIRENEVLVNDVQQEQPHIF
jgi:diguanylate cyclase (GGDEF)-like protein